MGTQDQYDREMTALTSLEMEHGISITPCDAPIVADPDRYIILKDKAAELSPLISEIPDLATTLVNEQVLGQTAYAITFNGQNVLPDQLFQKGNGALISNLKSGTGVGFGKQTDVTPIDFSKAQLANFANVTFGLACLATGMYYMKRIDARLGAIEAKTSSIQQFLEIDKFSKVLNDIRLLQQIMQDMGSVKNNEALLHSNLEMVGTIKREQGANIVFYEQRLSSLLEKYTSAKDKKKRNETVEKLEQYYRFYQLTLSTYALGRLMETQLSQHFDVEYLSHQGADFQLHADSFVALHDAILQGMFEASKERLSVRGGLTSSEILDAIGDMIDDSPRGKKYASDFFHSTAAKKYNAVRNGALVDVCKVFAGDKLVTYGMTKVWSEEGFQVMQPYLDVAESMEASYSSPMKMIVSGNDVYLEIKREASIQDNENETIPKFV